MFVTNKKWRLEATSWPIITTPRQYVFTLAGDCSLPSIRGLGIPSFASAISKAKLDIRESPMLNQRSYLRQQHAEQTQ